MIIEPDGREWKIVNDSDSKSLFVKYFGDGIMPTLLDFIQRHRQLQEIQFKFARTDVSRLINLEQLVSHFPKEWVHDRTDKQQIVHLKKILESEKPRVQVCEEGKKVVGRNSEGDTVFSFTSFEWPHEKPMVSRKYKIVETACTSKSTSPPRESSSNEGRLSPGKKRRRRGKSARGRSLRGESSRSRSSHREKSSRSRSPRKVR